MVEQAAARPVARAEPTPSGTVSTWISYDQFVDLVHNRHQDGFTGLVTGMTDQQHAFKIGFRKGQIVLLTYRILKGQPALDRMIQMKQVRIAQHSADNPDASARDLPNTESILSQLASNKLDDTTVTAIDEVEKLVSGAQHDGGLLNEALRRKIENAAVDHFGPIGAIVCGDLLPNYRGDLRSAVFEVAREVGASESDTLAFLDSASAG